MVSVNFSIYILRFLINVKIKSDLISDPANEDIRKAFDTHYSNYLPDHDDGVQ